MIPEYTMQIAEVNGEGLLAYSRGTFRLTFEFETDGAMQSISNTGNYLMIFEKQDNGTWLIDRFIWNDRPA